MFNHRTIGRAIPFSLLCVLAGRAAGQAYSPTPDWQSTDKQVSTGGALVDLNRDGWLDLVVANGNDISRQRVVAYYNNGSGALQGSPGWQSSDIAYHGHLDVGDVNGDGWPDVAVAVLLPQGGKSAKVYFNNNGTLATTAGWQSSIGPDTFGVAFGDMNGDGRPDLALASGDAYNNVPAINVVYLNTGSTLAAAPSWQTSSARNYNNCFWMDADRDGLLDLVMCGSNSQTHVYRNLGTTLATAPSWSTGDVPAQFCLMGTAGDVTGDGRRELIIADNNQIFGGSGRFRQYNGLTAGYFNTTANWTYNEGYAAAVVLGDIDFDGDLDLCSGEWFGRTRYFLNTGSGLPTAATWTSNTTSTVEKLCLGDINRTSLRVREAVLAPSGSTKLFHLPVQPVQEIRSVTRDGVDLLPGQYHANLEHGWVAIDAAPATELRVVYLESRSLDLAVTNWDSSVSNYVFYNKLTPPCPADFDGTGFVDTEDYDAFVVAFEAGSATADFDLSGFVDLEDFTAFVLAFEAGC
ncbi:MAG: VCBS repeat-containing protein [Phycisphaerales bacterium]|nr:VCBS repeat-containing protein [Phycisphaerales bacterium]